MEKASLFRQKSLERLSSPEQLNDLVRITTPLGWLALTTIGVALIFVVLWGCIGSVPITVNGSGILLRGGKATTVIALGGGQVERLDVQFNDVVKPGQVIGRITQPVVQSQILSQRSIVENNRRNAAQVKEDQARILADTLRFLSEQRSTAETSIQDYQSQFQGLQEIVQAQEKLVKNGLITQTAFLQTKSQLNAAQISFLTAQNQLAQLTTNEAMARNNAAQAQFAAENILAQSQESLDQLQAQMDQTSQIVSRYEGRVVDIAAFEGMAVTPGSPVVTLETLSDKMQAVLYFAPGQGKFVTVGMDAQVSPSTAPVSQYGFIRAKVIYVSEVPVTQASMVALLQNANLATALLASGPPIAVFAELEVEPQTFSGFRWSSSKGPTLKITHGTLASTQVIVLEQRPITLVIPLLKQFFGVVD
jgi:HlyD family secretion protein